MCKRLLLFIGGVILTWFVLGLGVANQTFAYFEDDFYCSIDGNSVTVSLDQGTKKCFDYIERIANRLASINDDINTAQEYIDDQVDRVYWLNVQSQLLAEKKQYIDSREHILKAMSDYEKELFLRVKSLISFYLKPEWNEVENKLDQADMLLEHLRRQGNSNQYDEVLTKRNDLYREWILLDAIKGSYSFETLLFPLKTYLDENPEL